MPVLIVSQSEVRRLLPMSDAIEAMKAALESLARGEALLPLRQVVRLPGGPSVFASMPGAIGTPLAIGLKAITVFPGNHGTAYDSHQGAVLLFEPEHGQLVAVMDASSITAIRTAAVSAVATRALAREDASDLALLGTGVQAATHLEALSLVRRLRRVRAWSRGPEHVRAFAERSRAFLGIDVEPAVSAQEAVRGADLVCTVTSAREPVLAGEWLAPGVHVNAVGSSVAASRELDTAAMARASVFVDRRESTLHESGDFLIAKADGAFGDEHILAELGEVLLGRHPGRRSRDEVTVFKSLGLAVEDVAAARRIHANALATGGGTRIDLGGRREDAGSAG
jgi:ornithine cyclodeaminase